ncbi:C-type lectin domain family 4 member E-like isoform X2 [Syngnathus acus]|uniref:C-type lectin domain family 4 member E-like isoform X2 n=1 Tax=Syngnathus acus TaxID=161584 RepID=UPI001885F46C|nr:C-type lectin domain family 4 member E-like isoform X2 [Syngnathus acus]
MPEADVLYSDLVFDNSQRNGGRDGASSAPESQYASVKVAKTQSKSQRDTGAKPARSKLTLERAALATLSVLLVLALVALCYLSYQNVQTRKKLQNLKGEHEALKANGVCWKCSYGWELYGKSCYKFSITNSTWEVSKKFCRYQNSDLVKIDSLDEQRFLESKLRDKMAFQEDKFWIGLTDSSLEGQWLWVDGSPLNVSLTFWGRGEPDNWSGEDGKVGEDCVRMGEKDGAHDLRCWFDKACNAKHKCICETAAQRGQQSCTYF